MFNLEEKKDIIKIKGSGLGSLTINWNECKYDTNPVGSTKANIKENDDILSSLQHLDLKDLCLKISPVRELDPKFEQSRGNKASTIALISRKLRTLGSSIWRGQGVQLSRLGGEIRAIDLA